MLASRQGCKQWGANRMKGREGQHKEKGETAGFAKVVLIQCSAMSNEYIDMPHRHSNTCNALAHAWLWKTFYPDSSVDIQLNPKWHTNKNRKGGWKMGRVVCRLLTTRHRFSCSRLENVVGFFRRKKWMQGIGVAGKILAGSCWSAIFKKTVSARLWLASTQKSM